MNRSPAVQRELRVAIIALFLCLTGCAVSLAGQPKPRLVVLTDVSTWETDDSESLVRLLVHADLLEIEGIVYTTGWSLNTIRDDFLQLIHNATDAYEKDLPNLRQRSQQTGFLKSEDRQEIGYWPSPRYLRERTVIGSRNRGAKFVGQGNDSAGSELIIRLADEADDRPLWITVWGGGNTLAQAIWRVKQDRSDAQFKVFLKKLRVYTITDQDRDQRTPFSDSSHQWLRREFGKDLLFLWDECAWMYQNGTGKSRWSEYAIHIQGHGHLGQVYPKYKYGVEGDTPSFLHLLQPELHDPSIPNQGGWGGYFEYGISPDGVTSCYTNHQGQARSVCGRLVRQFYEAEFNNFAARMQWAKTGRGNRNPKVVVDQDRAPQILNLTPRSGSTLALDASGSSDPDGDRLSFRWRLLREAGTYTNPLEIGQANTSTATLKLPGDSAGKTIHLICEVKDDGTPSLTSYRRIIIHPNAE